MRWMIGLAVGLVVAGCATAGAREVRQADIEAWREVPVLELETHPLFSTVPLTRRRLSDGSEMWDYLSCRSYQEDMNCLSNKGILGVNTTCSGGGTRTNCCHNQFIVRAGVVESYQPRGRCYTDCSKRPGARCASPDEVRVSARPSEAAVQASADLCRSRSRGGPPLTPRSRRGSDPRGDAPALRATTRRVREPLVDHRMPHRRAAYLRVHSRHR